MGKLAPHPSPAGRAKGRQRGSNMTRMTTIRLTERTDRQIQELGELFGNMTTVITVAIDRLYQTERGCGVKTMDEPIMDTEDRVAQVNWLREVAGNLVAYSVPPNEGITAQQVVEFYLESDETELPPWFDDHDRELLKRFVAEQL